jgi:hypothetical protein
MRGANCLRLLIIDRHSFRVCGDLLTDKMRGPLRQNPTTREVTGHWQQVIVISAQRTISVFLKPDWCCRFYACQLSSSSIAPRDQHLLSVKHKKRNLPVVAFEEMVFRSVMIEESGVVQA